MIEIAGSEGFNDWARRFGRAPAILQDLLKANFTTLGQRLVWVMRREVEPGKPGYATGGLWESIRFWFTGGRTPELHVGTDIAHAKFVRYGTRPHWAPIAPLKAWAQAKFGDEKIAYPVQRSIARYGTSMYAQMVYGTMENPFEIRTLESGYTRAAVEGFCERLGIDFVMRIVK